MRLILDKNDHVDVVIAGQTVRVTHGHDAADNSNVRLGGVDCNLVGEAPGTYYLEPLSEATPAMDDATLSAMRERTFADALLMLWGVEGAECSHGVGFDVDCDVDCDHNEVRPALRAARAVSS